MAKFSQNVLNLVAGFDGQVLAQNLVYDQKDYWNIDWAFQGKSVNGWITQTTPADLTGATITCEIVRRQLTDFKDGRSGLDFQIHDYPIIPFIANVTQTVNATSALLVDDVTKFFVGQPILFTNASLGGLDLETVYYVKTVNNYAPPYSITISSTQGGGTTTVTDATGLMKANRIPPNMITLPITNRADLLGAFSMIIDPSTWEVMAGDPELDINSPEPICFTGRIKVSFPANGSFPAYDEVVFLLFLINSDGVINING